MGVMLPVIMFTPVSFQVRVHTVVEQPLGKVFAGHGRLPS